MSCGDWGQRGDYGGVGNRGGGGGDHSGECGGGGAGGRGGNLGGGDHGGGCGGDRDGGGMESVAEEQDIVTVIVAKEDASKTKSRLIVVFYRQCFPSPRKLSH